jgi:hypothetical protein
MAARFKKLPTDEWGVLVEGDGAAELAGTEVQVRKRNGDSRDVKLGELVQQWDGGTKALYTAPKKGDDRPTVAFKGEVTLGNAEFEALLRDRRVVVDGAVVVLDLAKAAAA